MLLCLHKYTMPLQVELKLMCIECVSLYFSFIWGEFSLICLILGSSSKLRILNPYHRKPFYESM